MMQKTHFANTTLYTHLVIALWLLLYLAGCKRAGQPNLPDKKNKPVQDSIAQIDLQQIRERGYITAIMDNSSTGLFLYKGRPMGYEYELLSIFADSLGVELRFDITSDLDEAFDKLDRGEGDILAYNLTVTKERKQRVKFTNYHHIVRQVLVQRKPDNWRQMKLHEIERTMLRTPIELIGKEVHVRKGSAYVARLQHLAEEIGGDIRIVIDAPDVETEEIIKKVAQGQIDFTVADENVAQVNARYYPNLDIKTPISLPQQIAWGVRKNADSLHSVLNEWIYTMKKKPEYYTIYDKYFKSTRTSRSRLRSDYFSIDSNTISPYDSLIKAAARKIGWDWKLLAAQISRESKFDPDAVSWAGAIGLMQVLPRNGEEYGAKDLTNPVQNIHAGIKHIQWLQGVWRDVIPDSVERQKFILASYNVGQGHVQDALRLTKKYGADTTRWNDNVSKYLLLKSKPKYYNDEVVQFGYCRCTEPVTYVEEILKLYEYYLQLAPA